MLDNSSLREVGTRSQNQERSSCRCPGPEKILDGSSLPGPLSFLLKEVGMNTTFSTSALPRLSPGTGKNSGSPSPAAAKPKCRSVTSRW